MLRFDVCLYRSELRQPSHPGSHRRPGCGAILLPQAGCAHDRGAPSWPRARRSHRRDASFLGRQIAVASPRKTRQPPDRAVPRGPASSRAANSRAGERVVTTTPGATRDPGSFRDPTGFVYRRDGVLYRQINKGQGSDWETFRASGLYDQLADKGWLVEQTEVDKSVA